MGERKKNRFAAQCGRSLIALAASINNFSYKNDQPHQRNHQFFIDIQSIWIACQRTAQPNIFRKLSNNSNKQTNLDINMEFKLQVRTEIQTQFKVCNRFD